MHSKTLPHLLLYTNAFPNPAEPFRGIFTLQLYRAMQEHFHISVVSPMPWLPTWLPAAVLPRHWRAYAAIPGRYRIEEFDVHAPKYPLVPKLSENVHSALMYHGSVGMVDKIHRQRKIDIVSSHWLYPDGVSATQIARRLGVPVVQTAMGCDVNLFLKQQGKRNKIIHALEESALIITKSADMARELHSHAPQLANRTQVIYNGVDHLKFQPLERSEARGRLGLSPDRHILVYIGRLDEEKGVNHLLSAMQQLYNKRQDTLLYIIGDGSQADDYRSWCQQHNMQETVHFAGKQPHDSIALWLNAADLFVLPSLREGCPNVILEALACGTPVTASRVGGIPELLSDECGLMFEAANVNDMTEILDIALEKQWNRERIVARARQFSWETSAENYRYQFNRLLGNTREPIGEHHDNPS